MEFGLPFSVEELPDVGANRGLFLFDNISDPFNSNFLNNFNFRAQIKQLLSLKLKLFCY